MPRLGPRRPLELGKSVIEFRLTSADADIKALLEAEGNISATIRKALRLYALYRAGAVVPVQTADGQPPVVAPAEVQAGPPAETGAPSAPDSEAARVLLDSLEADWV